MASDPKSIDEVMEDFNRLHNIPIDVTESITHDEFVVGVREGRVGIKVTGGEPISLVTGARKTIFNMMVLLYLLAPLLVIPFWAYHEHNWWLLFGIVIASVIAPQIAQIAKSFGGLLFLLCGVLWFTLGFHHTFTFLTLCALWGFMFFQIAESCQNEYALQCLTQSPELFARAVAEQRIMVIRRREPHEQ